MVASSGGAATDTRHGMTPRDDPIGIQQPPYEKRRKTEPGGSSAHGDPDPVPGLRSRGRQLFDSPSS
eukprot:5256047-Pyramimonas_sp.AAC.1